VPRSRRRITRLIEGWLTANGVIGLYPANSVGDNDIEIHRTESRTEVRDLARAAPANRKKQPSMRDAPAAACLTLLRRRVSTELIAARARLKGWRLKGSK
jgi:5-methyltetrahydrofolate--homocysteine methyltransferase